MARLANKRLEMVYTRLAGTPRFREHAPRGAGPRPHEDFRTCAFIGSTSPKNPTLTFTGDDARPVLPSTSVALGLVEKGRGFSGCRIEADILVNNCPADQGDNYPATLGFFCDQAQRT
jgi:hypothetical protein